MSSISIEKLGWKKDWPGLESKIQDRDLLVRIIEKHKDCYTGMDGEGSLLNCYITGSFRYDSDGNDDLPAVGDWCLLKNRFDDEKGLAGLIEKRLDRVSHLSRVKSGSEIDLQVMAANVDKCFILTSANDDFNLNRLQRYLFMAKQGGVEAIIVLTKVDLIESADDYLEQLKTIHSGEVISLSNKTEKGVDLVREKIGEEVTIVFVGSSGVGKSSLTNKLLGEEKQLVKDIRGDDSKGKHTTTRSSLMFLENGGMIIDTAGIRELQIIGMEEILDETFVDIQELMENCKFNDCSHNVEKGCAVLAAIEFGEITEKYYKSYQKLQKELARKQAKKAQGPKKRRR